MHKNPRFNIIQVGGNDQRFYVVHGQRLPSGIAADGAVTISEPMSRDEAIALADKLEKVTPAAIPGIGKDDIKLNALREAVRARAAYLQTLRDLSAAYGLPHGQPGYMVRRRHIADFVQGLELEDSASVGADDVEALDSILSQWKGA